MILGNGFWKNFEIIWVVSRRFFTFVIDAVCSEILEGWWVEPQNHHPGYANEQYKNFFQEMNFKHIYRIYLLDIQCYTSCANVYVNSLSKRKLKSIQHSFINKRTVYKCWGMINIAFVTSFYKYQFLLNTMSQSYWRFRHWWKKLNNFPFSNLNVTDKIW